MAFRIDVQVKAVTEKAVMVASEEFDATWVPKSVLTEDSEITEDALVAESGTLEVPTWFAEKQGWA